jgi:hypothetical protein
MSYRSVTKAKRGTVMQGICVLVFKIGVAPCVKIVNLNSLKAFTGNERLVAEVRYTFRNANAFYAFTALKGALSDYIKRFGQMYGGYVSAFIKRTRTKLCDRFSFVRVGYVYLRVVAFARSHKRAVAYG